MSRETRTVLVGLGTFLTALFVSVVLLGVSGGAGAIEVALMLVLSIVIGVMAGVVVHQRSGSGER
jgi:hypothetical protein